MVADPSCFGVSLKPSVRLVLSTCEKPAGTNVAGKGVIGQLVNFSLAVVKLPGTNLAGAEKIATIQQIVNDK